jgi:hypothetical protein
VPARGKYNIDSDPVLASAEETDRRVDLCWLILEACRGHHILLLSPLPRYMSVECCEDSNQPPNQQYASVRPSTLAGLKKKKARTTYSGKWPTCYCYMLALETQQMRVNQPH